MDGRERRLRAWILVLTAGCGTGDASSGSPPPTTSSTASTDSTGAVATTSAPNRA